MVVKRLIWSTLVTGMIPGTIGSVTPTARASATKLVARGPDAAEMRHRLEPVLVLDVLGDLDGPVARRAAGAVGDRDVVGLECAQLVQRQMQVPLALVRLGWEEFEREDGLLAG